MTSPRCETCPWWERIEPEPMSGCWLWIGAQTRGGYGHLSIGGKSTRAHRAVYEQMVGAIPEGHDLHHACECPQCVNPEHLTPIPAAEHRSKHARLEVCSSGHPMTADDQRREAVLGINERLRGFDKTDIPLLYELYDAGVAHAESGEESQYEIALANALRDARQALAKVRAWREMFPSPLTTGWIEVDISELDAILAKAEGGSDGLHG